MLIKWLSGPEKLPGLSRNGSQGFTLVISVAEVREEDFRPTFYLLQLTALIEKLMTEEFYIEADPQNKI